MLTLCAFLATSLTSCARSIDFVPPALPDEAVDLRTCTDRPTVTLPPGSWTRAQAAEVIGSVRRDELYKDRCAKEWDRFYRDLRGSLER